MIAPGLGGIAALHRGGGGAQHQQGIAPGTAELRHVPGMVADHALGLVAALLLLVQDDEAQVFHRGKDGRPGADDHRGQALPDPLPLVEALPGGKAAVEDRHLPAEMGQEDAEQAGGQGDLGD